MIGGSRSLASVSRPASEATFMLRRVEAETTKVEINIRDATSTALQGELEEAIRDVMTAKPFLLEVNDAQVRVRAFQRTHV